MARSDIVSSSGEELILVDEFDREIGQSAKSDCHAGSGVLHRAFSIFLFNDRDELLLQRRSAEKPLWPDYWSNTCCSHPRVGETMEQAVSRRLLEELGVACPLHFLYKFKYHAQYGTVGAEHEYCWVYYGRYSGDIDINEREISAIRYVPASEMQAEIESSSDNFTPWLKMEWAHIMDRYLDNILNGNDSSFAVNPSEGSQTT
ncbi:MAG TPA: isopentenyl-diphosphate Delta-isomerase [Gammaproteobacteria bacterium]